MGVGHFSKLDIFNQLYEDKIITEQAWCYVKIVRRVARKAMACIHLTDHVSSQLNKIETMGIGCYVQQQAHAREERQWRDLMTIFKRYETRHKFDTHLLWLAIDPTLVSKSDLSLQYLMMSDKLSTAEQRHKIAQVMNALKQGVEIVCKAQLRNLRRKSETSQIFI